MKTKAFAAAVIIGVAVRPVLAFAGEPARFGQTAAAMVASLRAQWASRAAAGQTPATIVEPSIVAGAILTPSIDVGRAPGVPALQITVKAGTVGLSTLIVTLTSPDGSRSISTNFITPPSYPAEPAKETFKFAVTSPFTNMGFDLYTQPGTWTLSGLALFTKDGQIVEYGPTQLGALFPSTTVNVTNAGTPDVRPPTAVGGAILTPTVSLGSASPTFAARLNVRDDVSGVSSAYLGITGPSGSSATPGAYVTLLYPVMKGSIFPSALLPADSPAGTYTITSVQVCDVAGNCVYETASATVAALFGTSTFQVTQ